MSESVFCDIIVGSESADRLYENEHTLAFLDPAPATPGYALVLPTTHHETLTDMDPALVGDLFHTARRVTGAVESVFAPDGVNIIQSNGTAAGQDVFHAHVHIVPRYENDGITLNWSHGELIDESGHTVAAAIRDEL